MGHIMYTWERQRLSRILLVYLMILISNARASDLLHPIRSEADSDASDYIYFVTRPDIKAPRWSITVYNKTLLAPGYWFVAPYASLKQDERRPAWVGPHIYDQSGGLIWSGSPTFRRWNAFDFGVTTVEGQQMLSLLYSHDNSGVILDDRYQIHKSVALGESNDVSHMHEFNVIDDGSRALVTTKTFQNASIGLSQTVGFDGECFAKYEGFRELDLVHDTSQSLFEWRPEDHIGLLESTFKPAPVEEMYTKGWDLMYVSLSRL